MLKGRFEKLAVKGLLWILILSLLGIAVLLAGATWEVRNKENLAYRERENAQGQFEEVSDRRKALLESVESFSNDRGREEEFRKRFPVALEGEEVIVLVDAKEVAIEVVPEPNKSLWSRFKNLLNF